MKKYQNFVDGTWVDAVEGQTATIIDPSTEQAIAEVPKRSEKDVNRAVEAAAAATLKRVHLELGGKAPVVVFDDADLQLVVETVKMAGFANSGQDCTAACRLCAAARAYDRLLRELVPAVESIKVGDINSEGTEMGPLVSAEQRQRVTGFVERAVASDHVRVLTGGSKGDGGGFFFKPTVIAGPSRLTRSSRRRCSGRL